MPNSAIDAVTAHFLSLGRQSMDVPEWGLAIHWAPITIEDRIQIRAVAAPGDDFDYAVHLLIRKAQDAEGNRLFSIADRRTLLAQADASVLERVVNSIVNPGDTNPGNS